MQYLIIGNSAAGLNAAEAIRTQDAAGSIIIVSEESYPAYSRCLIPYFMEGKVSEEGLRYRPADYYTSNRFQTLLGRKVVAVQPSTKSVALDTGEQLTYDKLLIATGGSPQIPATPGMAKDGVFGFRTTQDLQGILRKVKTARSAVVLGGGCVGLMAANGLQSLGLTVTVVIRSPHLLSQIADAEAGEIVRRKFAANGVAVIAGTDVAEVLGDASVTGVKLENGEHLPCEIIVVGKGVNSNIDLVKGTDIRTHWGILVDDELCTSVPGIYAAGDVAETKDIVTGEDTVNAIWPAAAEQGRIAGMNMSGARQTYQGSMRMNSAEFFGLPVISIGLVKPKGPDFEVLTEYSERKQLFRKVVLHGKIIVGVVLVGQIEGAGVYAALMRKKVDITLVKERLLSSDFGFATVLPLISKQQDKYGESEYREALLCSAE